MSFNFANEKEGSSRIKRNLDDWKYPKIPIDHVYKKKLLKFSPTYAVKDYENTITVNGKDQNVSGSLLSSNFLEGFIKKQHRFVHLGLVQIAIKPLMRDGLGGPIIVRLRDARHVNIHNSLLALVKANLCQGPIYFNCFPSFSVSSEDASLFHVLTIDVETSGIPLALTYRIVCKAMVDLSPEALGEPVLGETAYFQPATETHSTTKWEESPTINQESKAQDEVLVHTLVPNDRSLDQGITIANEKEESFQKRTKLDDWKYPKIPIKQVYNSNDGDSIISPSLWSRARKAFMNSRTVKEYENTVTLEANNQTNKSLDLLKGFIKKRRKGYVHLGLIQIAIKPLMSENLGDPVVVCLRDNRILTIENSLLAFVRADASQGPFYFNCCPRYSVPLSECHDFLTLHVMSEVPLLLTYRLVCDVTSDVNLDYGRSIVRGETTYHQPGSGIESITTKWVEEQLPVESS